MKIGFRAMGLALAVAALIYLVARPHLGAFWYEVGDFTQGSKQWSLDDGGPYRRPADCLARADRDAQLFQPATNWIDPNNPFAGTPATPPVFDFSKPYHPSKASAQTTARFRCVPRALLLWGW